MTITSRSLCPAFGHILKRSSVNEQIDRMRHAATRALLERDDVIIVASVSLFTALVRLEPIRP